ncbi:MAG TPA: hypothetical protein DCE23_02845 [Firmicutes bacterium]|nr:hypothetical protein [Bacillota bacterium]
MEKNDNFKSELEVQYGILIEANEKAKKQRYIFLLSLVCLTFISVLVSVFFSYKALDNSNKINKGEKESINTNYLTLSTIFKNGNDITINNIDNGYIGIPKEIQITNDGDTDITFNIKISSIKTTLISTNNLVYILTKNGEEVANNVLPLQEKIIANEVKISPKETITYTINTAFNGILEQNNNTNEYHANITIEQNNNKGNLLE